MPIALADVNPPKVRPTTRSRAGRDIATQRKYDHRRRMGWPQFEQRSEAVMEARAAVRRGERGARFALRQALVDLASCCEELVAPMAAPNERLIAQSD